MKTVNFKYDDIIKEIQSSDESTSVYVGCDSKRFKKNGIMHICYVTCIILHYNSKHGAKLFKAIEYEQDYTASLKYRLMREVQIATDTAMNIIDFIGNRSFSIHLDINPDKKHKSSIAVKEALGYVFGMLGIDAVLKPNSFAASAVADRFVNHIS